MQLCKAEEGLERYPGCRWATQGTSDLPKTQGCLCSKSQTAPGFVLCWINQNHPFVSTERPWPVKEQHSTVLPCTACSRPCVSSPLPTCVNHRSQGRDKRTRWGHIAGCRWVQHWILAIPAGEAILKQPAQGYVHWWAKTAFSSLLQSWILSSLKVCLNEGFPSPLLSRQMVTSINQFYSDYMSGLWMIEHFPGGCQIMMKWFPG